MPPSAPPALRKRHPRLSAAVLLLGIAGLSGAALEASETNTSPPTAVPAAPSAPIEAAPREIHFNSDIRPLLSNTCVQCHGPDDKKREGGLRLDTFEGATEVLKSGVRAIVPGQPDQSELLKRILSHDPDDVMPPPAAKKPPLTPRDVAVLRRWIEQGAPYQGHWAFLPLTTPEPPPVPHTDWAKNPIDHFTLARLEVEGLAPSPEADPSTLLRRLHLDLTGLPPTAEEIAAFAKAHAADPDAAVNAAADRLLASPHYGERWGRHWLDQARYADSNGYAIDGDRVMWPYRDWVINALNRDLPFDQFTIEQLAGDLLPNATKEQRAATAFHRNTLINEEGGTDPEQFRVEAVMDRVNTTGAVWLGLTLSCAQCHTHKYDPITHREYYQLYAFFNSGTDRNNAGATIPVARGELLADPYTKHAAASAENSPQEAHTGHPPHENPPAASTSLAQATWHPVAWKSYATESNAGFERLPDNSLLSDGRGSFNDTYRLTFKPEVNSPLTALRLRTLPHESLPSGGPGLARNGNFVLTHIEVTHRGQPVKIAAAFADHEQDNYPARSVIDADPRSGWAINVRSGSGEKIQTERALTLVLAEPLDATGEPVEIRLFHGLNENYLIGRLALETASVPVSPAALAGVKETRSESPEPQPKPAALMIMEDAREPRETFVFQRGDFTRPDKEAGALPPGIIAAVDRGFPNRTPEAAPRAFRSRLDLAKWLADPGNPLTPRVTVNRVWMRYFGKGLVETEEDFGTQGTPPSHPELLDWLAAEFIRGGWSMKHLHRLIATSATYRQASQARSDLDEKDPRNLLLARQSRLRLDAEIVRDAALAASGLLNPSLGGPSVRPPQPEGVYAFTQQRKKWDVATDGDRFRRTLYTFFYRSAPHPLFGAFDAPDFQVTCTRRSKSNTPLQSLTLANDPMFIELAQGLAARLAKAVPGDFDAVLWPRLQEGYRLALGRSPSAYETTLLAMQTRRFREHFAAAPDEAASLAFKTHTVSTLTPAEAAALTNAARILFNLDEFITRE